MKVTENFYDDYLYDCRVANSILSVDDWEYYGKEVHHVEIPKCEGGVLTPLNSQPLTAYQHWVAGVLQSELVGRKCFAMIPKGVLPGWLESLRIKWQTHHNRTANFTRRSREEYAEMGRKGGLTNKGRIGRKLTEQEIEKFILMASQPKSEEHKQKLRENAYDITGWIWITNGEEETMVPPGSILPQGWGSGRKPVTEETRKKQSERTSGENNPMYGVTPKTKNMRWYKDLKNIVEKMFVPGEEPAGWVKGRLTAHDRRLTPLYLDAETRYD
jgi:hypothetical protein